MNIKEELEKLNSSENFGADVIKQVINQQEELEQKLYILKVAALANKIESVVNTDLFINEGIHFVQLNLKYTDEAGHEVAFYLLDEKCKTVSSYYEAMNTTDNKNPTRLLYIIFENFGSFDPDLINPKMKTSSFYDLPLQAGIKDGILDLFLNKKLRNIYDYSMMQSELPEFNENSSKKLKM